MADGKTKNSSLKVYMGTLRRHFAKAIEEPLVSWLYYHFDWQNSNSRIVQKFPFFSLVLGSLVSSKDEV